MMGCGTPVRMDRHPATKRGEVECVFCAPEPSIACIEVGRPQMKICIVGWEVCGNGDQVVDTVRAPSWRRDGALS